MSTLRSLMLTSVSGNYGPFVIRYPRGKGNDAMWREKTPEVIPVGKDTSCVMVKMWLCFPLVLLDDGPLQQPTEQQPKASA